MAGRQDTIRVAERDAVIEIRALTKREEFERVVRMQEQIWGFHEADLLPARHFIVAEKIGGQVFGAFDRNRMVGFLNSVPGIRPGGQPYLHSQMLGVLPEYHNAGLGRALKLRQREDALERGIDLIEWTFDPLEIKNAYFNLERLGAIVRRYVENQYGASSSPLHGGLPTDRCVAEWWVASERVKQILAGSLPRRTVEARIAVPSDIQTVRREDPERAREIQKRVAGEFQEHTSRGLAAIGFERSHDAGTYLLGRWE
jgi:predicted GNAT superfamily acetyltransferase